MHLKSLNVFEQRQRCSIIEHTAMLVEETFEVCNCNANCFGIILMQLCTYIIFASFYLSDAQILTCYKFNLYSNCACSLVIYRNTNSRGTDPLRKFVYLHGHDVIRMTCNHGSSLPITL